MRLTIELMTEEPIALRRFHAANQTPTLEEAAALALREFLIGTGDLELAPMLEEDSMTDGKRKTARGAVAGGRSVRIDG